jgi:hypothetical protein
MAAIKWSLCLEVPGQVSYKRYKLVTMLLQCLLFAFDLGLIQEQTDIWQQQIQRHQGRVTVLGIGIYNAISSTGYRWFLPHVD